MIIYVGAATVASHDPTHIHGSRLACLSCMHSRYPPVLRPSLPRIVLETRVNLCLPMPRSEQKPLRHTFWCQQTRTGITASVMGTPIGPPLQRQALAHVFWHRKPLCHPATNFFAFFVFVLNCSVVSCMPWTITTHLAHFCSHSKTGGITESMPEY